MSAYAKLLQRAWSDADFTALSINAQQMYLLLLSSPDRSNAGVLPLTIKRWANWSSDATVESVRAALAELAARDFIVIDWDTEEVLIRTFIRNDGGYKTPNVAQSVARAVAAVQSLTLREVLRNELQRLMIDADDRVKQQFSSVVEGLTQGLAKGLREPIAQAVQTETPVPMVVGTYLSNYGDQPSTSNLQPAPAAPGGAAARARASDALNAASALVSQIVPKQHPRRVVTGLRDQACELLADGTEPDLVAEALKLWLERGISAPSILPSLVSDAIKLRSPTNGHKLQGASRKVSDWAQVKQRMMNQPNTIQGELER